MTAMDTYRLSVDQLAWRCDPALFDFDSTTRLPELDQTIGQLRALTAIDFGLGIRDSGFNIFILGEPGTGRSSTIKKILARRSAKEPIPGDWCYVHDFSNDTRPRHILLPAGLGRRLQRDMETLIGRVAEAIPKTFESKEYEQRKSAIAAEFQEKNRRLFEDMEKRAAAEGFVLQRTVGGLALVPTHNGEPLSQADYEALSAEDKADIDRRGSVLQARLNEVHRTARLLDNEMGEATVAMEREMLLAKVGQLFAECEERYRDHPGVLRHFAACKEDLGGRLDEFRPSEGPRIQIPGLRIGGGQEAPSFERYLINLLLDNGALQGAPVVYEANPTYFNLFGRIEHIIHMGGATTNFTMIKAGALHRANGGYLILDCREVLLNLFSYEALKRAIRDREVRIEDMAEQYRLIATVSLKPEPIPLDCKIVLIGTPLLYYLLFRYDEDFPKYFKVKADFDGMMENSRENVQQYALFVAAKCREEELLPFAPEGVARLVEYSARLIDHQGKLSSRFLDIADLIREAAFYATRQGVGKVGREQVEEALRARVFRSDKIEQRLQEAIEEGTLLIDTAEAVVGQVNGLSVYLLGDYAFGRPSRVTVRTYLGKAGVVNIEREAKLSGPIHDKGVLILAGFLGDRFAQDKPLTLAASICFEQSYAGVEGDSASSTELYALLSALSGLPLRQGMAVTGSVNQRGQVQPIGGVNEKVEGFFAVCRARGLTGDQGVIIPAGNVKNLMLATEVIEAVAAGRFHVWGVDHVDQGIELLTGVGAGERGDQGWPAESVNGRVDKRLREMAETLHRFGKAKENETPATP